MFNDLLNKTLSRVKHTADELRQSVSVQAAKARDALGLPSLHPPTAEQLERLLESQAAQPSTLPQLHELYVRWLANLDTNSQLYDDISSAPTSSKSTSGALDFDPSDVNIKEANAHISAETTNRSSSGHRSFEAADNAAVAAASNSSQKSTTAPPSPSGSASLLDDYTHPAGSSRQKSETRPPPPPPPLADSSTADSSTAEGGGMSSPLKLLSPTKRSRNTSSNSWYGMLTGQPHVLTTPSLTTSPMLTFRQVFLRSCALEVALVTLARLGDIRELLVRPADDVGEGVSTRGALQRLMALTMAGSSKLHQDLLFLFCSVDLDGPAVDIYLRRLVEISSVLKFDWREDRLRDMRQQIAIEIQGREARVDQPVVVPTGVLQAIEGEDEAASSAVPKSESPTRKNSSMTATGLGLGDTVFEASLKALISAAAQMKQQSHCAQEIVHLHRTSQLNIEEAQRLHVQVATGAESKLERLRSSLVAAADDFAAGEKKASEGLAALSGELGGTREDIAAQKRDAAEAKAAADEAVVQLTEERQVLLSQLQTLDAKLAAATMRQAQLAKELEVVDRSRVMMEGRFRRAVKDAEEARHRNELHRLDMQNLSTIVGHVLAAISVHTSQQNECISNQASVEAPLLGRARRRYVQTELKRMEHLSAVVEWLISALRRANAPVATQEAESSSKEGSYKDTTSDSEASSMAALDARQEERSVKPANLENLLRAVTKEVEGLVAEVSDFMEAERILGEGEEEGGEEAVTDAEDATSGDRRSSDSCSVHSMVEKLQHISREVHDALARYYSDMVV